MAVPERKEPTHRLNINIRSHESNDQFISRMGLFWVGMNQDGLLFYRGFRAGMRGGGPADRRDPA
jgi:hypothetical protein